MRIRWNRLAAATSPLFFAHIRRSWLTGHGTAGLSQSRAPAALFTRRLFSAHSDGMFAVIVVGHEAEKIVSANIPVSAVRDQPDLDAHLREPADRLQRTSQMRTNADNDQTTLGTKAGAWPGNSQSSRQWTLG
jgi:hypothetical protein